MDLQHLPNPWCQWFRSHGAKCVLARKVNQVPLQRYFGHQRQKLKKWITTNHMSVYLLKIPETLIKKFLFAKNSWKCSLIKKFLFAENSWIYLLKIPENVHQFQVPNVNADRKLLANHNKSQLNFCFSNLVSCFTFIMATLHGCKMQVYISTSLQWLFQKILYQKLLGQYFKREYWHHRVSWF